jgi:hypothetical protein
VRAVRRVPSPRAGRPWRPRHSWPEAPLTEAVASLGVHAPMHLGVSRVRVASPSRRTRVVHRSDRWSDPRAAVRASDEALSYHGGIFVVSTPSPPSAYLRSLPAPVRAMPSRPTLAAPPCMDVVATEHKSVPS